MKGDTIMQIPNDRYTKLIRDEATFTGIQFVVEYETERGTTPEEILETIRTLIRVRDRERNAEEGYPYPII